MLNSFGLAPWFCFRNYAQLCQLANSDILRKELKSWDYFDISFVVGEIFASFSSPCVYLR